MRSPARLLPAGLAQALTVDRTALLPWSGLRCGLAVAVPLSVGVIVGQPAHGALAAAGALPTGVAALGTGTDRPTRLTLATTVGMTLSTFVGGLVAGHLVLTLVALAGWGTAAGLVVVLGRDASVVGVQAVIGLAVFGRFPGSVADSAGHAGLVAIGGLLQVAGTVLARPPRRYGRERLALGSAYDALARLALDVGQPAGPAAGAVAAAAAAVRRRAARADDGDPRSDLLDLLRGLADEAGRIRLELAALASFAGVVGVGGTTSALSARLAVLARRVGRGDGASMAEPSGELDAAVAALRADRDAAPAGLAGTAQRYVTARASAAVGQLRAAERLADALDGARRVALPRVAGRLSPTLPVRARWSQPVRQLVATIGDGHSPAWRHGIRMAVVLPACEALSRALPVQQRGYWVTLTAAVVLRPEYGATMQRGIARVLGTLAGAVLAGAVVDGLHPGASLLVPLVFVFAWGSYAGFAASYAVYSLFTTGLVVLLVAPTGAQVGGAITDRALATAVGGAVALASYAVWPTWESATLRDTLERLVGAVADYADAVLAAYADPRDLSPLAPAAAAARQARVAVEASLARARAEPARIRADPEHAARILAAARRVVTALQGLRATVEDATERPPVPQAEAIRAPLVAALRADADAIADRAGQARPDPGTLRDVQQSLAAAVEGLDPGSLPARRLAVLAALADPLVDAVDTLGFVVSG